METRRSFIRPLWILVSLVLFSGCVQTNATLLGPSRSRSALLPTNVILYRTAVQVPGQYEEVALLHSKGNSTVTSEPQMYESMQQKAAEIGANGIILEPLSEPSAGAKIAAAFLGTPAERQGKAVAIYVYPPGQAPLLHVPPPSIAAP